MSFQSPAPRRNETSLAPSSKGSSSLASLARSLGVGLNVRKDFKAEYDRHGTFLGYKETGLVIADLNGKAEAIAEMRERVYDAFEPASLDQVENWLVELSLIAPRRHDSEGNDLLRVEAYSSRLSGYPADVVKEALLDRVWRFWPSWAELHDTCEELMTHRRAVRAALDRACAEAEERKLRTSALPTEETATMTPEEMAESRKRMAQSLGDLLSSFGARVEAQRAEQDAAAHRAADNFAAYRPRAAE